MLTHRGFSSWIVANGKPLPEYLVAVDDTANQISCWIPSEANQAFAVYWQDHDGKVDTCSFITLDGFVVPGRFLLGNGTTFRSGVRTSKNTEKPFLFQSNPETADGTTASQSNANDIGMITLRIKRVKRISSRPANEILDLPLSATARQPGDMRVGYGKDIQTFEQYNTTWLIRPHDDTPNNSRSPPTYVSFVFRYRSREFLMSQGIMPRQPSTASTSSQIQRTTSLPIISSLSSLPSSRASSPHKARDTRSLPSTMHRPRPLRLQTMPQQVLEQTSKSALYKDPRKPAISPARQAPTRRAASLRAAPYHTPTGLPGQGRISLNSSGARAAPVIDLTRHASDIKMEMEDSDEEADEDDEDDDDYYEEPPKSRKYHVYQY